MTPGRVQWTGRRGAEALGSDHRSRATLHFGEVSGVHAPKVATGCYVTKSTAVPSETDSRERPSAESCELTPGLTMVW
jgi:hypothetical protein